MVGTYAFVPKVSPSFGKSLAHETHFAVSENAIGSYDCIRRDDSVWKNDGVTFYNAVVSQF